MTTKFGLVLGLAILGLAAGCDDSAADPVGSVGGAGGAPVARCDSHVGYQYTATYVTEPGNDCGDIATHTVFFTDEGESCVTVDNADVHKTAIMWSTDGTSGVGRITYTNAHKVGGGTCSGSWSVTYVRTEKPTNEIPLAFNGRVGALPVIVGTAIAVGGSDVYLYGYVESFNCPATNCLVTVAVAINGVEPAVVSGGIWQFGAVGSALTNVPVKVSPGDRVTVSMTSTDPANARTSGFLVVDGDGQP